LEQPIVRWRLRQRARGNDGPLEDAAAAVVNLQVLDPQPRRVADDQPGADQVVPVQNPDVAEDAAFGRKGLVVVVRPGGNDAARLDHDGLVEGEQRDRDADAGNDQGGQYL